MERYAEQENRTYVGLVEAFTAHAYGVPVRKLKAATRLGPRASRARQVAMYLAHVVFGVKLVDVAEYFRRDPSTTSYAVRRVEGLRDDPEFDRALDWLEAALRDAAGTPA